MKTAMHSKLYFGGISAPRNAPYPFPKNSILDRLETRLGNHWLPWYVIMPERPATEYAQTVPNLGAEPKEFIPDRLKPDGKNYAPGHLMLIEISALFSHDDWVEITKFRQFLSSGCETLFLCRNTVAEDAAPPLTWHGAGYREDKIFLMDELIVRSLKFPPPTATTLPVAGRHAANHAQELDQ